MKIEQLKTLLSGPKKIAVISHMNPDGDAVGSSLALQGFFRKSGHEATVILPNDPAGSLGFLPGFDGMLICSRQAEQACAAAEAADLIVIADLNKVRNRIGAVAPAVEANERASVLLIDHHADTPDITPDFLYTDPTASSTALLVWRLAGELGWRGRADLDIAGALYTGMMTDTGNFSYGQLTREVYETIAAFIDLGLEPGKAYNAVYHHESESRMRLWGHALLEKMVVLHELGSAYITLTSEELMAFRYREGDTEGLVNVPLSIEGIGNSAMFTEKEGVIRISLRSSEADGADMNRLAREVFGGGGHRNASGARVKDHNMEVCVMKYVEALKKLAKK